MRVGLNVTEIESELDRGELGKETSSARVSLNATESEQDTEDSGRDLKPKYRKD